MIEVGVIGVNHRSCSLTLRERFTRAFQTEFHRPFISKIQSILLVTCNRVELYFSSANLANTHSHILEKLHTHGLGDFFSALYSYFGKECFLHLGSVIAGLDSAIFGESDIQHQVKISYEKQRKEQPLPHDLHYLFQKALKAGKELRTSFLLSKGNQELPLLIDMTAKYLDIDLKKSSMLLIGNSRLNRHIISYFQQKSYPFLTLCTRGKNSGYRDIVVKDWNALSSWHMYDVVISATKHTTFVLDRVDEMLIREKRILLFDLGVPRNIHPSIGESPSISLYPLNQLENLFQAKKSWNKRKVVLCHSALEKIVQRQIQLFTKKVKRKKLLVQMHPSPLTPLAQKGEI